MPPHGRLNFPASKIAQLMIESKIHYRPVFDEREVMVGIVSVGLLRSLEHLDIFTAKIEELSPVRDYRLSRYMRMIL